MNAVICSNCGERKYGGYCTWCDEEYYIEQQASETEPIEEVES